MIVKKESSARRLTCIGYTIWIFKPVFSLCILGVKFNLFLIFLFLHIKMCMCVNPRRLEIKKKKKKTTRFKKYEKKPP